MINKSTKTSQSCAIWKVLILRKNRLAEKKCEINNKLI